MKEARKKIRDALKKRPQYFNNRQMLKGILNDCLVDKSLQNNLLMAAYDANIGENLRNSDTLDIPLFNRLSNRLVNNHGLNEHRAGWAVITWFLIYNKSVPEEVMELWKASESNTSLVIATPSAITIAKPTVELKNKRLLETIFRTSFGDTPKWMFFKSNYKEDNIFEEDEISDDMKEIAMRVVLYNKYHEDELIHLRISKELHHGWALTHNSLCIGGTIGNCVIYYNDFYKIDKYFMNYIEINNVRIDALHKGGEILLNVYDALGDFLKAAKNICLEDNVVDDDDDYTDPPNYNSDGLDSALAALKNVNPFSGFRFPKNY